MCDFSLHNVKSRPATVGDKLTTHNFITGTCGFAAPEDSTTAVCILPGTELAGGDMCVVPSLWLENNKLQNGDLSTNRQGRTTGASRRTRISGWHACSPDGLA